MSAFRLRLGRFSGGLMLAATLLGTGLLGTGAPPARAAVSVEDLTGTAVSGVGPYYQDVADAIKAFGTQNYSGALNYLQRAKKSTPALAPPEVMLARLYYEAGQAPAGNAQLEKAIASLPNDPEAYVGLVERAVADGRVTEASALFPTALKLVEGFTDNQRRKQNLQTRIYSAGAAADETRGDLEQAKTKLEALVKLDATSAPAHERLGRVLFLLKDQKNAYDQFKLASEADKKLLPAEMLMAVAAKDKATTEKWLDFAVKQGPNDQRVLQGAANYFLRTNQVDRAKPFAEQALKLDPDGFETNYLMGLIARLEADYPKAEKHLSRAHLLAPIDFGIMSHLALVLLELPDEKSHLRAMQLSELCVAQNPNSIDLLAAYGWINYRLNRQQAAQQAFNAVLNSKELLAGRGMTADMGYYLANIAAARGNSQEAANILRDALKLEQPFAYRKPAQLLLEQLTKAAAAKSPAGGKAAPAASPGGAKAPAKEPAAKEPSAKEPATKEPAAK